MATPPPPAAYSKAVAPALVRRTCKAFPRAVSPVPPRATARVPEVSLSTTCPPELASLQRLLVLSYTKRIPCSAKMVRFPGIANRLAANESTSSSVRTILKEPTLRIFIIRPSAPPCIPVMLREASVLSRTITASASPVGLKSFWFATIWAGLMSPVNPMALSKSVRPSSPLRKRKLSRTWVFMFAATTISATVQVLGSVQTISYPSARGPGFLGPDQPPFPQATSCGSVHWGGASAGVQSPPCLAGNGF